MISIKQLSFNYRKSKREIFSDFSLSLKRGKIYGLLGKNGVGKSTLLYLMSGLLTPKRGQVVFQDTNVRKRLPVTLQDIFIVPEEFDLPPVMLRKYVELTAPFYPHFDKDQMIRFLRDFEMDDTINLKELSMGQKKKVFICFALAANTSLLIMDEPTNGLDIPAKSQFRKVIASSMTDARSIIISTHQVRDIDKLLDHILILDHNRLLLDQPTYSITDKLLFIDTDNQELLSQAIYSIPSLQANSLVLPNNDHIDSALNLESLFNATLESPGKITALFNPNNTEKS